MSNIISIDYGRKYLGIALVQSGIPVATPLPPLVSTKHKKPLELASKLINSYDRIDLIIIGNPLGIEGKPTEISEEVLKFAERLTDMTGVKHLMWDETFTSQIAESTTGIKKGSQQSHSEAARIILQEYLDHQNVYSKTDSKTEPTKT